MKNNLNLNEEEMDAFAEATVQYNIEKQLREKYDKILANKKKKKHKKSVLMRLPFLAKVAAVVVAIIGSLFLIQNVTSTSSPQSMAQRYLDHTNIPGNPDITRKGANSAHQLRREANDAFILKNYPLAISKYEDLAATIKSTSLDKFYLGVSHLKTDDFSEAIEIFRSLKKNEQIDTEVIDWLLSLAYVLSNQEKNAVPILEQIVTEESYQSEKAKDLLESME